MKSLSLLRKVHPTYNNQRGFKLGKVAGPKDNSKKTGI